MMFPAASAWRRLLLPAALVLPVLMPGCSGRPAPVARVGSEYISVVQFQDAARGNEAQYQGVPDTAKTKLLEDLVRRSLLIQEAKRRHLVPDTTLERTRRQESERIAVDRLVEVLVPRDIAVSDAEVADFYKKREVEAHMTLIFVLTKAEAEQAKADLDRGEDFASVATRFNPAGMMPPGGDLGFLPPGALLEPLDQYLFDGPLNKLVGPVEIKGQGWAIAKLLERRPHKQESLDAQKNALTGMIRQRKQRQLQQNAFLGLRDQYRVRVEPGGGQTLFQHFNNAAADTAGPIRVLARYDGKGGKPATYTFADALGDLQDATQQRPNLTNVPLIEHWIELQVIRRASSIEAQRRHLDQEPEVRRRVEERVNNILLEHIYNDEVASKIGPATPEDVRAVYERRAEAFLRIDAAKLQTLTLPDSASAAALVEHVGHGGTPSLRELAGMVPAKLKATARVVERDVRFPSKDPVWTQIEPVLLGLQPGDLRGPAKTPSGWMFFQLVSKQQGTQAFDKLPPPIQHALEQEALEARRDQRLNQFTDSLRAAAKVEIYHDNLKKVPWPVPRAARS